EESRRSFAAHRYLLPSNRRLFEGGDDLVGDCLRHIDERERVGNLDGAQRSRLDAGLARDRADEVARPDAGLSSGADEETHRPAVRFDHATASTGEAP